MLIKILGVLGTTVFAMAQMGAQSASLFNAHEPQVPAKLQVKE